VQIPRPTEAGKDRFRSAVPADARVEVKPMFGNLGAFVNGNMFAGLFGDEIGVKLGEADREALVAVGGGPYGPPERPMGGYLSVPADQRPEVWIGKALEHVATFPPKKPRRK
jgi:TfoX/Sxy family transcriptional regulator of competence genes